MLSRSHSDLFFLQTFVVLTCLTVGCSDSKEGATTATSQEQWQTTQPDQNVVRQAAVPETHHLSLNLKPGDRFPLRKIVEQELNQDTVKGSANQIKTRLELLFAISVLEKAGDRTKLGVRYEQVRYEQHIGSEAVLFDSTQPRQQHTPVMQAYRDMIGDGFAFWLGPNNQILEVEGFTEFLNRCLRNIPESERQNVMLGIESGSGESGIGNFIDNSIGLLPYGGDYEPGDSWERPSHVGRPVPMHLNNRYTLKQIDDKLATIAVRGQITPSTTVTPTNETNGVRVTIRGGETTGNCVIFRETGLPMRSHVEQKIDMTVMMSGAIQFNQQKKINTTIESFPASSSSATFIGSSTPASPDQAVPPGSPVIQRVSGP